MTRPRDKVARTTCKYCGKVQGRIRSAEGLDYCEKCLKTGPGVRKVKGNPLSSHVSGAARIPRLAR